MGKMMSPNTTRTRKEKGEKTHTHTHSWTRDKITTQIRFHSWMFTSRTFASWTLTSLSLDKCSRSSIIATGLLSASSREGGGGKTWWFMVHERNDSEPLFPTNGTCCVLPFWMCWLPKRSLERRDGVLFLKGFITRRSTSKFVRIITFSEINL